MKGYKDGKQYHFKKYSHVGLYVGDNTVIEAMSTINGVTTSRVTAGKWTHWGELIGVAYDNAQWTMHNAQSGTEAAQQGSSRPTLRRGSKGQAVTEMQDMLRKLGYDLGSYGVDGDFGKDNIKIIEKSCHVCHSLRVGCTEACKTETVHRVGLHIMKNFGSIIFSM